MLIQYAHVFVFVLVAIVFIFATNILSKLVHTKVFSTEKYLPYECGEDPVDNARIKFNTRFFIVALIFLIFDVEIAFLFPWGVVFRQIGMVAFVEMFVFILILLIGLAHVWVKKDLEWIRTFRQSSYGVMTGKSTAPEPPSERAA